MYPTGLRVRHLSTSADQAWDRRDEPNATVLRVTDYGDVVIKVDGDPLPIHTRPCFLIP